MENQSMSPQPPSQQPSYYPRDERVTPNVWRMIAIVLFIALIGIGGVYLFNTQSQKPVVTSSQQILPQKTVETKELTGNDTTTLQPQTLQNSPTKNKIFYTKYYPQVRDSITNNIFAYDYETKEIAQLTNYTESSFYIRNIRVIDENSVGFLRCSSSGDYADCGIYVIDITSKKINIKKKLERQTRVSALGFASSDTFAYEEDTGDESGVILKQILVDKGIVKILEQIGPIGPTGRGGHSADDVSVQFSPNKQYILEIDTAGRSIFDDTVYVYNLSTGLKQIVPDATHPQWLNNTTIVYRKYPEQAVYLYDIESQTHKMINEINQDAYYLSVLPGGNKMLFTDDKASQIWLYDFTTKENKKILENARHGFWLTPTKIVYNETRPCNSSTGECGMLSYVSLSTSIFDIEKGLRTDSIPEKTENIQNLVSYYAYQF